MKILVIEPHDFRRADLADAICELPGIEVHATVSGLADGRMVIACEPIDVIVAGELPPHELAALNVFAESHSCAVVTVSTVGSLSATLQKMASRRTTTRGNPVVTRSKYLAFERDRQRAGLAALTQNMTAEHPRAQNANQTLDLKEWLPRTIAQLRPMVPDYIELVQMVAADTPAVQCVPAILEHVVFELVIQACAALPWGGTVWLTAGPGADGEVKLDVLENGEGEIHDLTLRASAAPACS